MNVLADLMIAVVGWTVGAVLTYAASHLFRPAWRDARHQLHVIADRLDADTPGGIAELKQPDGDIPLRNL